MRRFYQLTYLVRPDLKRATDFCEKINALIQKQGGILGKTGRPQKRSLGESISKKEQDFKQALMNSVSFYLDHQKIQDLRQRLEDKDQILRLLLSKAKEPKKSQTQNKSSATRRPKEKKEKPSKVDSQKVEQKIEEVLEE